MRQAVSFQFVVEIRVRVEMENRKPWNSFPACSYNRQCDRMISAETNRAQTFIKQFADAPLDHGERLIGGELQVACVAICAFSAEINPRFGPEVRRVGAESNANNRRRAGGPAQP